MKKGILLLILTAYFLNITAQTQADNLKKYWYYRDRLRKSFISFDSHVESQGYNLPASEIYRNYVNTDITNVTYSYLSWSDNNAATQHYIGMLATELWLLKNNGQQYETTLKELFYAVIALERLDLYSESEWSVKYLNPRDPIKNDINGILLRDDVKNVFFEQEVAKGKFVIPGSQTAIEKPWSALAGYSSASPSFEEISQDNIIFLLPSIALVGKLCGTEYVKKEFVDFNPNHIMLDYLEDVSRGIITETADYYVIDFQKWANDFTRRLMKSFQHEELLYFVRPVDSAKPYQYHPCTLGSWGILVGLLINPLAWLSIEDALNDINPVFSQLNTKWYLKNPITNQTVMEGSGRDWTTEYLLCWGLAEAGNWIDPDYDYHFYKSSVATRKSAFILLLEANPLSVALIVEALLKIQELEYLTAIFAPELMLKLIIALIDVKNDNIDILHLPTVGASDLEWGLGKNGFFRSLSTIMGEVPLGMSDAQLYYYLSKQFHCNVNPDEGNPTLFYDHYPLIYTILHDKNISSYSDYNTSAEYWEALFNDVPSCGMTNFLNGDPEYFNTEWCSSSRLVWPQQRFPQVAGGNGAKIFSGLDFMFLYNLYCIAYSKKDFRKVISSDNITASSSSTISDNEEINPTNTVGISGDLMDNSTIIGKEIVLNKNVTGGALTFKASDQVSLTNGCWIKIGGSSSDMINMKVGVIGNPIAPYKLSDLTDYYTCDAALKSDRFLTALADTVSIYDVTKNQADSIQNPLLNYKDVIIYPNPCHDFLSVKMPAASSNIEIIDQTGRIVYQQGILNNGNELSIDLSSLSAGMYAIKVYSDKIYSKKFIKK